MQWISPAQGPQSGGKGAAKGKGKTNRGAGTPGSDAKGGSKGGKGTKQSETDSVKAGFLGSTVA